MLRILFPAFVVFLFFLNFSSLADEPSPPRIVFLGDSLTEGLGVAQDKAYPAVAQKLLNERGKKVEIINAGVSGDTSAGGRARMKWLFKNKPQYLFLALGANDGLRGVKPESTKENLEAIIKAAQEAKVKVLLAGMKLPVNMGKDYRAKFEEIFPALAKQYKLPFLPFLLEGVGAVDKYNQADKIHPNEAGHKVMAKTVADFLETHL